MSNLLGSAVLMVAGIGLWAAVQVVQAPREHPVRFVRAGAPSDSSDVTLDLERTGDQLHIQGMFSGGAPAPGPLTYRLRVRREGAAGTTRTQQGGSFRPVPGTTDTLSVVTINVAADDRLTIHFVVEQNEEQVGTARVDRIVSSTSDAELIEP